MTALSPTRCGGLWTSRPTKVGVLQLSHAIRTGRRRAYYNIIPTTPPLSTPPKGSDPVPSRSTAHRHMAHTTVPRRAACRRRTDDALLLQLFMALSSAAGRNRIRQARRRRSRPQRQIRAASPLRDSMTDRHAASESRTRGEMFLHQTRLQTSRRPSRRNARTTPRCHSRPSIPIRQARDARHSSRHIRWQLRRCWTATPEVPM